MISLRKAQENDSADVFNWRNDPETREASINTEFVTYVEHETWFSRCLSDPSVTIYIATSNDDANSSVGICRFNTFSNTRKAEVSINLNPSFRGRKLAQKVLHESIKMAASDIQNVRFLTATIKETNTASLKIFMAEQFTPVLVVDGIVTLELEVLS